MNTHQDFEELTSLIDLFRSDFAAFAKFVFSAELSPKQLEFCEAWRTKRTITFRGGTSLGKSFVEAIVFFHSLICFDHVQVTIVGPSEPQLRGGVWRQIQQLNAQMHPLFADTFEVSATKVQRKTNPANCFGEYRLASGDRPDNLRGVHAFHNHWIVDEASGIDDEVFTGAILNALSDPDGRVALISNPSRSAGFFFRTFRDPDISPEWTQVHGTLFDSPNYDPVTFEQLAKNFGGPLSRDYQIMVLGNFPVNSVEGLIPANLIETAVANKDVEPAPNVSPVWGVDPAFRGDASVLCIRHDTKVLELREWRGLDATQLAYALRDLYLGTPKPLRPSVIAVDATGLGHGVASNLKDFGLPVHSCIFAASPARKPDRYTRTRDMIWGEMAEWFQTENVSIPNNPKLLEELACATYSDETGRIKLEDKKSMKKKLGRSPDYADALAISFSPSRQSFSGKYSWSKPIQYDFLSSFG